MDITLRLLPYGLSICNVPEDSKIGPYTLDSPFVAIVKSDEELSCVCATGYEPPNSICKKGFRAFRIDGTLDLSLVGVMAPLLDVLKRANVSVSVISTYKTDYILVHEKTLDRAILALASVCRVLLE